MADAPLPVHGFVGLGHQGTPMAQRMIDCGLRPWLWARRPEILDRYRATDAVVASSPAELGARCDVVGVCMLDADATDAVLWGDDAIMATARPGTVLAIHGTVGVAYIEQLARRCAARGVHVVDAPVSGGDLALTNQLLVILGGDDEPLARCAPMLAACAGEIVRVGGVGAAQGAKMVNNTVYTAMAGLLFDAFDFGDRLGIDRDGLGTILAGGSAATLLFSSFIGLGPEQFSIRAWPTLHKDLDLARPLAADTGTERSNLIAAAGAAVDRMVELRAGYEAAKQRGTKAPPATGSGPERRSCGGAPRTPDGESRD